VKINLVNGQISKQLKDQSGKFVRTLKCEIELKKMIKEVFIPYLKRAIISPGLSCFDKIVSIDVSSNNDQSSRTVFNGHLWEYRITPPNVLYKSNVSMFPLRKCSSNVVHQRKPFVYNLFEKTSIMFCLKYIFFNWDAYKISVSKTLVCLF